MAEITDILKTLDRAGYHLTGQRQAMAELIASHPDSFTADDLVAEAAEARPPIGRATVFRSLEIFESLSLVERVHVVRSDHAYVVCDPVRHHHHLVCERCGRNTEIRDVGISAIARDLEDKTGYRVNSHRFELFGVCPDCQATSPNNS